MGENLNSEPIFITTESGQKIRILLPTDVDAILSVIKKDHLRTLFSVCFWTGMRYVEVQRLHKHPEWIMEGKKQIILDRDTQQKPKRVAPVRYVPIPPQIQGELAYFFKNQKPPAPQNWNNDLKRFAEAADLGTPKIPATEGILPKATRASIESWMFAAGLPESWICLRQGHDKYTSLKHYQGVPFSEAEILEIKHRIGSWKV